MKLNLLDVVVEIQRHQRLYGSGPEQLSLQEFGRVASPRSHHVLGRIEELQSFIAHDPGVVHTRGGDGQTPLHFASSVAVAQILLAAGADINALDVDHESTPAQYMLRVEQGRHYPRDRQSVARYLIQKGCNTDLLMAALAETIERISGEGNVRHYTLI